MLLLLFAGVMCGVFGFVGWKGGPPERWMAATIFLGWCIFAGLCWADGRASWVGLAASSAVQTAGMAIGAHIEMDLGTRRWLGLIHLLTAVSMVFGGAACLMAALDVGPVVLDALAVNQLASAAALAFLVLATVRRMKMGAEQPAAMEPELEIGQQPPSPLAIN